MRNRNRALKSKKAATELQAGDGLGREETRFVRKPKLEQRYVHRGAVKPKATWRCIEKGVEKTLHKTLNTCRKV